MAIVLILISRMAPLSKSKIILLVFTISLGGCADYMNNRDSVTLGLGDAPEANLAIQTVDPFPQHSRNTRIEPDAGKVNEAYRRYQEPCDKDVAPCRTPPGGPQVVINNNGMPGAQGAAGAPAGY
ncbi:pilus assembly protein [Aminobacter ciceronei]|uniref:Lipoprotein n=1 Tax=Aminobacter ciceronei TaxID=150723 RepID=A0ABR6CFZ6_9HYPH|nr:pilus assembly protein [Aminobacter ciceronei]MBA8910207.1 hypothetical protein [Aminobacter ciceronei]MBA9023969.1 hypothetical protein [Aminobacter ciceronei]